MSTFQERGRGRRKGERKGKEEERGGGERRERYRDSTSTIPTTPVTFPQPTQHCSLQPQLGLHQCFPKWVMPPPTLNKILGAAVAWGVTAGSAFSLLKDKFPGG